MMRPALMILAALAALPAWAEIVVPARTIRAREIIAAGDLVLKSQQMSGAVAAMHEAVGMEARVALYPGRPIRRSDIGPPAIVDRNALVQLVFRRGALIISTEGRALGRGGAGDRIRVMNLASRATVSGRILPDGTIEVVK